MAQPNSTMIFSALEERTLGKAYVDDINHPANCLLVTNFQNLTFTHRTVDQQWLNLAVAEVRQTEGIYLNWPSQMAEQLEPPPNSSRHVAGFEFLDYSPQGSLHLPADRQLQLIDAELFSRCTWRDLMLMGFGTVENFLRHGIGVCVMDGHEICSEAYAAFLGAGKFEIGVVTNEKYRRQGNAYLACKHLIQLVEERGYPPHWSYFEGNAASAATARKLGFRNQRAYKWLHYP
jgi:hypothetical protein